MDLGNMNDSGPRNALDTDTLAAFRSLLEQQSSKDLHTMISAAQFRFAELQAALAAMRDEWNRRNFHENTSSNIDQINKLMD